MADTTDKTNDEAASGGGAPGKPKKKRLGRGLGSLLSIPVDLDSGEVKSGGAGGSDDRSGESVRSSVGKRVGAVADAVLGLGGGSTGNTPASAPVSSGLEVTEADSGSPELAAEGPQVHMLGVDAIRPNRFQPRTEFAEGALEELAGSIERSGLMQPLVVRSTGNTESPGWELIAGERRLRAIKHLGRSQVPAIIVEAGDQEAAEMALIENLQREDLNPLDRATALATLRDDFGLSQAALAERVGLDRSSVANLLRILELDDFSAAAVRRGALTLGHAKALLALTDDVLRRTTAAAALNGGWSVRELERRIRHLQGASQSSPGTPSKSPITNKQANVVDLERRLGELLGMRVAISLGRKKGSGKLQIEFTSLEEFDSLTERLGLGASEV